MNYSELSLKFHNQYKGKIALKLKMSLKTKEDLSWAYTPGVAAVSRAIGVDKNLSFSLTNRANQVAIVSDGSAILGLGNLGPEAAMPVMEGKACLFKYFGEVDAFPLCVSSQDTEEIIKFCKMIEPSFGGINLEDISAPRCFEILERLENELKIPVFHDDQDGTAIVVLAALINACKVADKKITDLKIVINGAGAAGIAIAKLILTQSPNDLIILDSQGIINQNRINLNQAKKEMALKTNKQKIAGDLQEALKDSDVFIGVSQANVLKGEWIKLMHKDPIIFAMANPDPEILPSEALKYGAFIVGTGRSDFNNQINNALVFPGLFRGILDNKIQKITQEIKLQTAYALADSIKPKKDKILPSLTDKKVAGIIAKAVK